MLWYETRRKAVAAISNTYFSFLVFGSGLAPAYSSGPCQAKLGLAPGCRRRWVCLSTLIPEPRIQSLPCLLMRGVSSSGAEIQEGHAERNDLELVHLDFCLASLVKDSSMANPKVRGWECFILLLAAGVGRKGERGTDTTIYHPPPT